LARDTGPQPSLLHSRLWMTPERTSTDHLAPVGSSKQERLVGARHGGSDWHRLGLRSRTVRGSRGGRRAVETEMSTMVGSLFGTSVSKPRNRRIVQAEVMRETVWKRVMARRHWDQQYRCRPHRSRVSEGRRQITDPVRVCRPFRQFPCPARRRCRFSFVRSFPKKPDLKCTSMNESLGAIGPTRRLPTEARAWTLTQPQVGSFRRSPVPRPEHDPVPYNLANLKLISSCLETR
jgi:hypothetical protein